MTTTTNSYVTQYLPPPAVFYETERERKRHLDTKKWVHRTEATRTLSSVTQDDEYAIQLSEAHLYEIDAAITEFDARKLNLSEICRETFPIPKLGLFLAEERRKLHHELGLCLLRGIQPEQYTRRQIIVIFAGIASYLAETIGRQPGGKFIGHIRDLSEQNDHSSRAAPYRNTELPFHTDAADIVGMYVLSTAMTGGEGTFASVGKIYDTLAVEDPELVHVLMKDDWPFVKPPTGGLYYTRSLISLSPTLADTPEAFFSRGFLIDNPESSTRRPLCVPSLTALQAYALDAFHFVAVEHALILKWQPGDMCFFNNRRIVHGRKSFRNGESQKEIRHILRLWLGDEQFAGKPPLALIPRWKKIFAEMIENQEETEVWPLEPVP